MDNRVTIIGLNAYSLYTLIMALVYGIIVLLFIMLLAALTMHSNWYFDHCRGVVPKSIEWAINWEVYHRGRILWNSSRLYMYLANKKGPMYTTNRDVEIAWTLFPVFILMIIMVPSLLLLYSMEDLNFRYGNITMKVIGHQWYWSYQYIDNSVIRNMGEHYHKPRMSWARLRWWREVSDSKLDCRLLRDLCK